MVKPKHLYTSIVFLFTGDEKITFASLLAYVDVKTIYIQYSSWIDFFLYFLILGGVIRAVLVDKFPGRAGNVISIGLGLALSLALSLSGFELQTLGPWALGIIIIFLVLMLSRAITHLGSGSISTFVIIFIILYISAIITVPDLLLSIVRIYPFIDSMLNLIFLFALVALLWKMVTFVTHKGISVSSIKGGIKETGGSVKEVFKNIKARKEEKKLIKRRLGKVIKKERKQSSEIIDDLNTISEAIDEHGNSATGRKVISKAIQDIYPKEHYITQKLDYLRDLIRYLRRLDVTQYEELKKRYSVSIGKEKRVIGKELRKEEMKIACAKHIAEFEAKVVKYDQDFRYALGVAIQSLNAGKVELAKRYVGYAVRYEKGIHAFLSRMKHLERFLLRLTKGEVKLFRKEIRV